ncbi:GNAT family N-acetyltransferase [Sinosporangium siamense]|uniref:N-acetyltransferase domain-containing protein n=1 Tax=Sinosporangium siamense TaxID=1367973 RepID=A0A919V5W0_9ACTN|nr:GNAT family N-acetyltransferase [Sinosporangium siamense]GII93435.1 hypothetical protein Ssi02_36660 [Sinosporangium siamense]
MTAWKIERVEGGDLEVDEVLALYHASGLGERRPVGDVTRFTSMIRNANLIVTCRIDGELVGIARSISDFCYTTYLSDLAVSRDHQRAGIGRALIEATQREAPQAKIVLLAAPAATDYYPHIGFAQHHSAWTLAP